MTKQILFWVTENSFGETNKHWLKIDCPNEVEDLDDADSFLQTQIQSLMDANDWSLVFDFKPTKIGFNLLTPAEAKVIRDQKTKSKKLALLECTSGFVQKDNERNWYGQTLDFSGGAESFLSKVNETLKGKSILFIENSNILTDQIANFVQAIEFLNLPYKTLFNLKDLDLNFIVQKILEHKVIVFQTTWQTEMSHKLRDFLVNLKQPKTIIECRLGDPIFWRKPKNIVHDIIIADCFDDEFNRWSFVALDTEKSLWEIGGRG